MTSNFNVFDRNDRKKMLEFTGVVVESNVRTMQDGTDLWQFTIYNKDARQFIKTESVKIVPMQVPDGNGGTKSNPGYPKSALYQRFMWWDAIQVEGKSPADYEGYYVQFETKITETPVGTSVRSKPVKKLGRVTLNELLDLQAQLKAQREGAASRSNNGGMSGGSTTPARAEGWSPEEQEQLLGAYHGRSDEEAQAWAFRNLPESLANDIMTGAAGSYLIRNNVLSVGEDGKYIRTEA